MMKTIHLIYLNFFHSVARSPGRSLRKLGDLTHIFKYHQGGCYASDTVAQGGWQQHPSHPVPAIFTRRPIQFRDLYRYLVSLPRVLKARRLWKPLDGNYQ